MAIPRFFRLFCHYSQSFISLSIKGCVSDIENRGLQIMQVTVLGFSFVQA